MRKITHLSLIMVLAHVCNSACSSLDVNSNQSLKSSSNDTAVNRTQDSTASLAHAYAPFFSLGAAVNRNHATEKDREGVAIVQQHFSVLTAENDMKWESIQPAEGHFTFSGSDALVSFAKQYDKEVIGHVLVWYLQTPDWVFEDATGNAVSREVLLKRMKEHIFSLAGRYKNDIKGWDVVNEALNEDGSLRESRWQQIIGDDYIEKAFEYAAEAAPNAALYYNDYNLFKAEKMDGAIALASRLRAKGIRIDGIGIQAHYSNEPPLEELEQSIKKVIDAGLKVMITELDLTVLKFPDEDNVGADITLDFAFHDEYDPYKEGISEASHRKLASAYIDLFSLFLKYHEHIDRVTLWGVSDKDTWRNYWPMKGRTDYPLLFDRQHQAKDFVDHLIAMAESESRTN